MIRVLHTGDLHLGARFRNLPPEKAAQKRREQLALLEDLEELARSRGCQLALLAGDLFDRPEGEPEAAQALARALEAMEIPVFIAPGNHDYRCDASPYQSSSWPGNVHIFTRPELESVTLPDLGCRVWGAGYRSMDCPGLMSGFQASGGEPVQMMVLHGDPVSPESPCCPVTREQLAGSGLAYLALGHIHRAGTMQGGRTLCAWPGCPMGRGFDETGVKGVYLAEVSPQGAKAEFVPLNAGRYEDLAVEAGQAPLEAVLAALPGDTRRDVYRITLTGEAEPVDLSALRAALEGRFFELQLRDRTRLPRDLWDRAGEDTLEGLYFRLLQKAMEEAGEQDREALTLAARISREILEGREVQLP